MVTKQNKSQAAAAGQNLHQGQQSTMMLASSAAVVVNDASKASAESPHLVDKNQKKQQLKKSNQDIDFEFAPFHDADEMAPFDNIVNIRNPNTDENEKNFKSNSVSDVFFLNYQQQNDQNYDIETHWNSEVPIIGDLTNFISTVNDFKQQDNQPPISESNMLSSSERQHKRQSLNSSYDQNAADSLIPDMLDLKLNKSNNMHADIREFSRTPGNVKKLEDDTSKLHHSTYQSSLGCGDPTKPQPVSQLIVPSGQMAPLKKQPGYHSFGWDGLTDSTKTIDNSSTIANNSASINTSNTSNESYANSSSGGAKSDSRVIAAAADNSGGNNQGGEEEKGLQENPFYLHEGHFMFRDAADPNGPVYFNNSLTSPVPSPIFIPLDVNTSNSVSNFDPDFLSKNAAYLASLPFDSNAANHFINPMSIEFNSNMYPVSPYRNSYHHKNSNFKRGIMAGKMDKHFSQSQQRNSPQNTTTTGKNNFKPIYPATQVNLGSVDAASMSENEQGLKMNPEQTPNYIRIIDDYRANGANNVKLTDFIEEVVCLSRDQHGSRFVQIKLEKSSIQDRSQIFNKLLPDCTDLMTDVFGNYVVQKLFEFCSMPQREQLFELIIENVMRLSMHMYGCRIIQKAIETLPAQLQSQIMQEIMPNVVHFVKDQNGNHVIQKCIEYVDINHLGFIIDSLRGHVADLSMHSYGCRVIQRLLEHCKPSQIPQVYSELLENLIPLIADQFGNYVIQHIIEHSDESQRMTVFMCVQKNIFEMSKHKFASNVVEKCLMLADFDHRITFIETVFGDIFTDSSASPYHNQQLFNMMKDQYANYVVQKMIDCAPQSHRQTMIGKIRGYSGSLRKYTHGKHLLAKLEKYKQQQDPSSKSFGHHHNNDQFNVDPKSMFPSINQARHQAGSIYELNTQNSSFFSTNLNDGKQNSQTKSMKKPFH